MAHRPSYDDWALPKGKLDREESSEAAAIREVLEETGYHCRVIAPLDTTRHKVGSGVKEVDWFAMRPLPDSPGFSKNSEIDRIRWLSPSAARKLVDYDNDRRLIDGADIDNLLGTGTIWLVRHGLAGERRKWKGKDRDRPLTKEGRRQAASIAALLAGQGVERVVSSPFARCVETVAPLSKATRARTERDERLVEGVTPDRLLELFDSLAGDNAVVCTHGDVVGIALEALLARGTKLESKMLVPKGSIWEIEVSAGTFTKARHHPPE